MSVGKAGWYSVFVTGCFGLLWLLAGCTPAAERPAPTALPQPSPTRLAAPPGPPPTITATAAHPTRPAVATTTTASPSPLPPSATPTLTAIVDTSVSSTEPNPTIWPTVTRQILPPEVAAGLPSCARRPADDGLLVVVTQQFGLSANYVPPGLAPLSAYFPSTVTVGIESYVRPELIEPLQRIITDMQAAGLSPSILSGYRSYDEQYLAWKWWNSQYPERVAIMSARAGHSEHQLATTVDFGSPELDHLFHVNFANTAEGVWLADNAHRYGFTMSYPNGAYGVTGFKYEPWHFRYVGVEMSTLLRDKGQTLTEWQLENLPLPCVP